MRRMRIVAAAGLLAAVILACSGARAEDAKSAPAPPEAGPAAHSEQPADLSKIQWDAALFAYQRPERFVVEESTPTTEHVAILGRPPQEPADTLSRKAREEKP